MSRACSGLKIDETPIDGSDARLTGVIALLEQLPLDEFHSFLDVGIGRGEISRWLAQRGKLVTGTGLEIASYGSQIEGLRLDYGVRIEECTAEQMPFADSTFDAVIMSHVLEHCPNVGLALQEVRRVIREDGCLIVLVPPHDDYVTAGHLSVGWNLGQLMYVLMLNGFDCRNGRFVADGPNVLASVTKRSVPLPALRGDEGDIRALGERGLFPVPVRSDDGRNDGFVGRIRAVNWDVPPPPMHTGLLRAIGRRGTALVRRVLPCPFRQWMVRRLWTVQHILEGKSSFLINPDALR